MIAKNFLQSHSDLLGDAARDDFFSLRFKIPRPPAWARVWYKILSLGIHNHVQLRQFYLEIRAAAYPYEKGRNPILEEMVIKACYNLKERSASIFEKMSRHGIMSVILCKLIPKESRKKIESAIQIVAGS